MFTGTPEQVLESIVDGINTGNIDALMTLYRARRRFRGSARQPRARISGGSPGAGWVHRDKGDTRSQSDEGPAGKQLALVVGMWSFTGTGPDGEAVKLTGHNADVLRRQADGSWRFVIDNPWGTD